MSTGPGTPLPPGEAWRRAETWRRYAEQSYGPERARAQQAAAYWYAQHDHEQRLRAQAAQAVLSGPDGPGGQGGPAEAGAWGSAGAYPTGVWPGTAPVPRRRRGRAVAAVVVLVLVVGVVTLVGAALWRVAGGFGQDELLVDQADARAAVPDVFAEPAEAPLPGGMEERWRDGEYTQPLADPVPGAATAGEFLPGYPDPEDWITAVNPANADMDVVVTTDPTLNCGMKGYDTSDSWVAAGCYNPRYATTIFLWWGPDADPAMKEFILAHELSHSVQWWQNFDVVQSATDAGLSTDDGWTTDVETDASCRVLTWDPDMRPQADASSSPCDVDGWSPTWLADRAADRGFTVEEY